MRTHRNRYNIRRQDGLTLIETMVACLILAGLALFTAQLFGMVVIMNKNNGSDATKSVVLAEAKIEELSLLVFTDTTTDTTVDPPSATGGSGLTAGGSIATPTASYCDFLDRHGTKITVPSDLSTPSNAAFVREWQILNDSATLKRIIVAVTSVRSFQYGTAPATTVVTLKTP